MEGTARREEQRNIDIRILLTAAVLVIAQCLALFAQPSRPLTFLWFTMVFAVLVIGYARGRVFGLLAALVAVFLFGSFHIYIYFIEHDITQLTAIDVLRFFLYPLAAFTGGHLGDYIRQVLLHYERTYGSVDELMLADPLTGLTSQKRFFFDLQEELERARRHFIRHKQEGEASGEWESQTPDHNRKSELVTLLLVEVVHFDQFRLLYGQDQADRLIVTIAEDLRASSRLSDRKARIAPALFAVILPETPAGEAVVVRERLLNALETFQVKVRHSQTRQILLKLRFGLATAPHDGATAEELYAAAERELQLDLG